MTLMILPSHALWTCGSPPPPFLARPHAPARHRRSGRNTGFTPPNREPIVEAPWRRPPRRGRQGRHTTHRRTGSAQRHIETGDETDALPLGEHPTADQGRCRPRRRARLGCSRRASATRPSPSGTRQRPRTHGPPPDAPHAPRSLRRGPLPHSATRPRQPPWGSSNDRHPESQPVDPQPAAPPVAPNRPPEHSDRWSSSRPSPFIDRRVRICHPSRNGQGRGRGCAPGRDQMAAGASLTGALLGSRPSAVTPRSRQPWSGGPVCSRPARRR